MLGIILTMRHPMLMLERRVAGRAVNPFAHGFDGAMIEAGMTSNSPSPAASVSILLPSGAGLLRPCHRRAAHVGGYAECLKDFSFVAISEANGTRNAG